MKKKIIIISTVVILGFGTILGSSLSKQKKQNASSIPASVPVETVKSQQVISNVDATGTVTFKNKVSIYAKSNGKVLNVVAKEGTDVSEGDVLINYDQSTLDNLKRQLNEANLALKSSKLALEALYIPADDAQLAQQQTQITQAERNIEDTKANISELDDNILTAKRDLENAKNLYNQGAISLTELTNFQNNLKNYEKQKRSLETNLVVSEQQLAANKKQYESLKNKTNDASTKNRIESQKVAISQAELRVSQIEQDIKKYEQNVLAPVTGTITKIYTSDGENVPEGKLLAEMGNLNDLIIESYIPEYDMPNIKVGQKVTIKSDSFPDEFEGSVTKIYPVAEKINSSGTEKNVVKVEISMPLNSQLKVGYSVKLDITTNIDNNALVIPTISYMTETNEDPYVYVVKEDGTLEKRRIKIKSFESSVVSVEGVSEGEIIVSSPDETLAPGMKITPLSQENTDLQNEQQIPAQVTGHLEDKESPHTL